MKHNIQIFMHSLRGYNFAEVIQPFFAAFLYFCMESASYYDGDKAIVVIVAIYFILFSIVKSAHIICALHHVEVLHAGRLHPLYATSLFEHLASGIQT
jgi:hypothetical protein